MGIYSTIVRPLAFCLEAERAHHLAIGLGARMAWAAGPLHRLLAVDDPRLATTVAGVRFANPIGLAAGFDKSGHAMATLAALGFGSVAVGSVSIDASDGNPKPRLWRLPQDRAVVVHYGLPNDGARAVAERVARMRLPVPLGINLVGTNPGRNAPPLPAARLIPPNLPAPPLPAPA